MTTIADLIARWNTDEGRPFKGNLIDRDAYEAAPDNIGCMCAQGQVLHLVGGWSHERLHTEDQVRADAKTAQLLNISRAHAVLLRTVNDRADGAPAIVLTDPGSVLGDQWSKLLDFWWHLDGLTADQWAAARTAAGTDAWATARAAAWAAAWTAARAAARTAAGDAAGDAAWAAAWDAAWAAAGDAAGAAAGASYEIQGAEILRGDGKPFFFLPAFGFASPADIPARPADYGITA